MPESFEDRRSFQRFTISFPLKFLAADYGQGEIMDISPVGIGIITDKELEPNASLEVWLEVPDAGQPLYNRGQVVWSRKMEDNKYRTGILLEKIDLLGMSRILRRAQ